MKEFGTSVSSYGKKIKHLVFSPSVHALIW